MKKKEYSCTVGENLNWCSHFAKQYGEFSKNKKEELPYDTTVSLLGIYTKKIKTVHIFCMLYMYILGFPDGVTGKEPTC